MRAAPLGRLTSLLLPALALAVVAALLWLTPADSARAQAQTDVWSSTLTVKIFGISNYQHGCAGTDAATKCQTALTEDDFTYKGTTYTFKHFDWHSNAEVLSLSLDDGKGATNIGERIRKALSPLTLNVDGKAFKVKRAQVTGGEALQWNYSPGPAWSAGQQVSLSLTGPATSSATSAYAPSVWVTSVDYASSPPNGRYYRHGETMAVAVNFSGPVTAKSKNMWLRIELNDQLADLWLHSGSGTDQWIFTEVVDEVLHGNDTDGFSVKENPDGSWVGMTARTARKYGPTVSFRLNGKINTQYQDRHQVKAGEKVPAPVQVTTVTCNGAGTHCTVPYNWKYAPKSLKKTPGASFRLMYVTSTGITGDSTLIKAYNTHAQDAVPGDGAFNNFSTSIRAMVNAVTGDDLRTNTRTRLTDLGAWDPIFWVKGKKVADSYLDLFDGSWDSSRGATKTKVSDENGNKSSGSFLWIWTGSSYDGSPADGNRLGNRNPTTGDAYKKGGELYNGATKPNGSGIRVYAITPLLTVGSE